MKARVRWTALAARVVCAGLASAGVAASAQDTPQRVEITGSSIKRTDAETALPVQVLTRQEIQASGAVNVEQLLQSVSALSSSGATPNSSSSGAATGGLSGISLRGLSSIRTLVLINGRRVAPYGIGFVGDSVSVDVNSIPLSAIERVEVLKDGASAIYGSDAIAGVVNFILRKDYSGARTRRRVRRHDEGWRQHEARHHHLWQGRHRERQVQHHGDGVVPEGGRAVRPRPRLRLARLQRRRQQRHHVVQHLPGQLPADRSVGRRRQPERAGLPGAVRDRNAVHRRRRLLRVRPIADGDAAARGRARRACSCRGASRCRATSSCSPRLRTTATSSAR